MKCVSNNDEKSMKLAEGFIVRQREAMTLTFKTRMREAIGHEVEDQGLSFGNARHWGAAAAALTSGATFHLKDDDNRQQLMEMIDRLPKDLEALEHADLNALIRGDYRLMLSFAEHGLTLTCPIWHSL